MEVRVFGALIALVMLAGLVLFVIALVDLVRRPTNVWEASGHNQLVWALVVVFVAFVGPLLYLLIARPALDEASLQRGEEGQTAMGGAS